MIKVNRPYHLNTETLSAFYETESEALEKFDYWVDFYLNDIGKYGNDRTITVIKRSRKIEKLIRSAYIQ